MMGMTFGKAMVAATFAIAAVPLAAQDLSPGNARLLATARECPGKIWVLGDAPCPDRDAPKPQRAEIVTPLAAAGNPGDWVPQTAYPSAPLEAGIEGTVAFTLFVDANGDVSDCRVTSSSGNDELDAAACASLLKRATFTPALDAKGNGVASSYSNRVRWIIPEDSATGGLGLPTFYADVPAFIEIDFDAVIAADGSIAFCEVSGMTSDDYKSLPMPVEMKDAMCSEGLSDIAPLTGLDGEPVRTRLKWRMEISKQPDDGSE